MTASASQSPRKTRKVTDLQLATVNGEPVTSHDLLAIFTDRHGGHAKFLGGNEEANAFLKIVIEDRLLVQEAYDLGLDQDPAVVGLVSEKEAGEISDLLIKNEIDAKTKATPQEIEAVRKTLTFFIHGQQIAVARKSEAEEVRRAILEGADIDALARSCSLADSRGNGGHIIAGWGQYSPEWEKAVFSLEPGEVSQPIETDDGWEVVVVTNRIDIPAPPADPQISTEIERVLSRRKLDERKQALTDDLWRRYHVTLTPIDISPSGLATLRFTAPESVIATWDGGGKLLVNGLFEPEEIQRLAVVTPKRFESEVQKRLRATINGSLVVLEGKARKLDEDPAIAADVEHYREYMMESLLYRDHIFRDVTVADEDLRKYYEAHKLEFEAPEERHVAHIMVPVEADAKALRAKLVAGADFREAAKKYSKDFSTSMNGGDLGWITEDKVPPPFKDVLSLPAGGLMKPALADNQWHIVKVLEIKPKRQLEFDEVKEKVRAKVLEEKKRAARQYWVDKLRAAATIVVDQAAITKFIDQNKMTSESPAPAVGHAIPAGEIKPSGETPNN